jgi:hypothetical protein
MMAPVMDTLPDAWSDNTRLTVAATLLTAIVLGVVLLVSALLGRRKDEETAAVGANVAATPVGTMTSSQSSHVAAPDLDPEEWVSGNVIHFDRYKAVGLIRCDRVKGHVRFQADGFKRAPRVGEKVRFKGRHGAMRKPVAVVVERAG